MVTALALALAGYAVAAGGLRIIRLHPGQSVRIGTVKVVALGATGTRTVTLPGTTVTKTVTAAGTTSTVPAPSSCSTPVPYPGNSASKSAVAQWMARDARARRLPGELPVIAALVASNLTNAQAGDADEVGFFAMRLGIWNIGKYAGFADHPDLQLTWFADQALAVWASRVAAGDLTFGSDPNGWGEWAADVERPPQQFRFRYQLRLEEARTLIGAGCTETG